MRLLKFSIIKRIKKSKGFTLIELLVVISIISLLSSVVMVAVKDAKEKADVTAFRASVEQFIKALEMYRNDHNGMYPGVDTGANYVSYSLSKSSETPSDPYPTGFDLKTEMLPYMKKLPVLPESTATGLQLNYRLNGTFDYPIGRCFGDASFPSYSHYVLKISKSVPGFTDWKNSTNLTSPYAENISFKCFSLQ